MRQGNPSILCEDGWPRATPRQSVLPTRNRSSPHQQPCGGTVETCAEYPRPRNGVFFTPTPNRPNPLGSPRPPPTPARENFFAAAANCGTWVNKRPLLGKRRLSCPLLHPRIVAEVGAFRALVRSSGFSQRGRMNMELRTHPNVKFENLARARNFAHWLAVTSASSRR